MISAEKGKESTEIKGPRLLTSETVTANSLSGAGGGLGVKTWKSAFLGPHQLRPRCAAPCTLHAQVRRQRQRWGS